MSESSITDKRVLSLHDQHTLYPLEQNTEFIGFYPLTVSTYPLSKIQEQTESGRVVDLKCPFCPFVPLLSLERPLETSNLCFSRSMCVPSVDQEQKIRLERVKYPRVQYTHEEDSVWDTQSHYLTLPNSAEYYIPECLFNKQNEVIQRYEHIFRNISNLVTPFHDPHLPKLELKHIDQHVYPENQLPALKDANFFLQKLNDYIIYSLDLDDLYSDTHSHTYVRCLMFINIFHPTQTHNQKLVLADQYYLTTGISFFDPEEED